MEESLLVPLSYLFIVTVALLYLFSLKKKSKLKSHDEIATMKTIPIFGHLHYLLKPARKGEDRMTTFLHIMTSMGKIFKDEHMYFIKIFHKKLLILTSADSAEVLLSNRDELEKSNFYDSFKSFLGNSIGISKGDKDYLKRRRIMGEIFHNKNMAELENIMNFHTMTMINSINQLIDTSKVDISTLLSRYTFKNALDICVKSHITDDEADHFLENCERFLEIMGKRAMEPWMHSDFIFNLTPVATETKKCFSVMFNSIKNLSESNKKMEETENYQSIFDTINNFADKTKYWATFHKEMEDVLTVIFGAFDTARNTLEWALFLVGHNTRIQEKIQQELSDVIGTDECQLTWENIAKLKYLKCVIKETLRLYPPGPFIARELKNDLTIKGKTVPKGTQVAVLISFIQRNERHFENPDLFYPERFESDNIPTFAFIPFSAGLRSCFGTAYGYKVMTTALAHIFFRFNVKSVDPEESIYTKITVLQRAHKKIYLSLKPRQ